MNNVIDNGRYILVYSNQGALAADLHEEINPSDCLIKYQDPKEEFDLEKEGRPTLYLLTNPVDKAKILEKNAIIWLYNREVTDGVLTFRTREDLISAINNKLYGKLGSLTLAPYQGWYLNSHEVRTFKGLDKLWWSAPKSICLENKEIYNLRRLLIKHGVEGFDIKREKEGFTLVRKDKMSNNKD